MSPSLEVWDSVGVCKTLGAPTTIASFCVVTFFGFLSIVTLVFYHVSLLLIGDASITVFPGPSQRTSAQPVSVSDVAAECGG